MEEWKEYRFTDVASLTNGRAYLQPELQSVGKYKIVRVGNLSGGDKWFYSDMELPQEKYCNKGDLLYAWACSFGPYIWEGDKTIYHYHIWKVDVNSAVADKMFLYYYLKYYTPKWMGFTNGSVMMHITKGSLEKQIVSLPSLPTQQKIASILSSLDEKIEVNRRINEQLEELAQAFFKSWFVDFEPFKDGEFVESELGMIPKGWRIISLSKMADYLNGLAMQKFRPLQGEKGLPVLKIKELGQDSCNETSELCSPSLVNEKYIVNDGDVIFSWSGTLLVKLWCGGICGLNQHLFKVTSEKYPKWFIYLWTKYHLDRFIRIAKDKAVTMGHIKRGELDSSFAIVPNEEKMKEIDGLMTPLIEQIIANNIESRHLTTLRDTLLPKLMSGEIDVNEVEI